jgi:hypothetical protein
MTRLPAESAQAVHKLSGSLEVARDIIERSSMLYLSVEGVELALVERLACASYLLTEAIDHLDGGIGSRLRVAR